MIHDAKRSAQTIERLLDF